jgi:hypothetical protein
MRNHSGESNAVVHAPFDVTHRPSSTWRSRLLVAGLIAVSIAGCGGDGKSSSGGGESSSAPAAAASGDTNAVPPKGGTTTNANPSTATVVGPNLNGQWSGYYKSANGKLDYLSATIVHTGRQVTINTTRPSGIVRELKGTIDSVGRMLMYDSFDREDWTTLYGPASVNSINLADYVKVNNKLVDTNILILKRVGG